jgi:phenylalanyl-tRNA synthetase beta chain
VLLSLDWLAEMIDLPPDAEIIDRLSMCGFEDVMVHSSGPDLSAVVVGHVVTREQHPDADKLSVCTVDVGQGEPKTIVCGAPNVAAGQRVAVALPGTTLPDGTKIKKSKLRGVVSKGMICSTRELALGEEHDGILVLDTEAPVGTPLPEVLPPAGRVLEVGITPNRGDTASVLGIAREVQAIFGGAIRRPEVKLAESGAPASEAVKVSIEANDGCYHYAARVVRGVKLGPSPPEAGARLEAAGVRPINNVVDATNLVLLEVGQPLHAFDLAKIRGGEIRVRRASGGEPLTTLDGTERKLEATDLVIADAKGPVALAGVMGGADSEVSDSTQDVLLESAHFQPATVRLTARRTGLHSEASYRFERGVDREGILPAVDRAAQLLCEWAGGQVAPGRVEARGDSAPAPDLIPLSIARMNRVLGTDISRDEAAALLARAGIGSKADGADGLQAEAPSYRTDLALPEDLMEEVARLYGYDRIPTTLPIAPLQPVALPPTWSLAEAVRDALAGEGLLETMTFPFLSQRDLEHLGLDADDPRLRPLRLKNPVQDQEPFLQPLLVPSLLRVAHQNRSRRIDQVRIFELGRVFLPKGEAGQADEALMAAVLITRGQDAGLWQGGEAPPLFFELRGIAERLLKRVGYVASLRRGESAPYHHPGAAIGIEVAGTNVGSLGELHPEVAARFEIDAPSAVLELDLTKLADLPKHAAGFRAVSKEPSVRRDIAVLLDREQPAGEVLEAIRKKAGADLVFAEIFDRYEGKGVPEGRVSLAFRLVFQRADRTLADAEVNQSMDKVVRTLTHRFGAELR